MGGAEAAGIVDELVGPGPPGAPGPPGSPRELARWLGIALGIHERFSIDLIWPYEMDEQNPDLIWGDH